jgi:hypothetical protein
MLIECSEEEIASIVNSMIRNIISRVWEKSSTDILGPAIFKTFLTA